MFCPPVYTYSISCDFHCWIERHWWRSSFVISSCVYLRTRVLKYNFWPYEFRCIFGRSFVVKYIFSFRSNLVGENENSVTKCKLMYACLMHWQHLLFALFRYSPLNKHKTVVGTRSTLSSSPFFDSNPTLYLFTRRIENCIGDLGKRQKTRLRPH